MTDTSYLRLWELYLNDCDQKQIVPTHKDFLVWLDEEGYEDTE